MHWLMLTAGTKLFRSYRIFQSIWLLLLVVYAVVCSSTNRSSESGRETRMTLEIWADELSVRSNKNSRKMAQEEREREKSAHEREVSVGNRKLYSAELPKNEWRRERRDIKSWGKRRRGERVAAQKTYRLFTFIVRDSAGSRQRMKSN